ncbi:MAG: prolyl oligopeptidase family serine peptidase [Pirellulales bacterium]
MLNLPVRWLLVSSWVLAGGLAFSSPLVAQTPEGTRVLPLPNSAQRQPSALYRRLQRQAQSAIQARRVAVEQLKSATELAEWNQQRRAVFLEAIGGLPERTPLNAHVTRSHMGDQCRVENILFESRPHHHVTGNLYLPLTPGPHPVVLVPCGHSYNGKAADGYQRFSMLLARNGIAAFCYDPIGQGERYQTFGVDDEPLGKHYTGSPSSVRQLDGIPGGPRFNPVEEHTLAGVSAILVGSNTAQYRIWDGMRAIDYLASRSDIDSTKIGCCGNSGGGTLTGYLMAIDDRIACAAPVCSLTSFERLLDTAGPQDAEQNLFGQLQQGLDQSDFLLMRAPRPTLLCAGTRDATFDILGTWELLRESKRVYGQLGYPERVDLAEADEPHGFSRPLRIAATRWMRRWLLAKDDAVDEPEMTVFTADQLRCTPRGQVLFMPEERSVFDLARDAAKLLADRRMTRWQSESIEERKARVRRVAGIRPTQELTQIRVESIATSERDGLRIEKLLFHRGDQVVLPALRYRLRGEGRNDKCPLLFVDENGKAKAAVDEGPLVAWARAGHDVLAVDLEGWGETYQRHPRDWGGELFGPNTQEFFLAYLLGQSLVGIHAEDLLSAASILRGKGEPQAVRRVQLEARGDAARIAALHAAFVEPQWFSAGDWLGKDKGSPKNTKLLEGRVPATVNADRGERQPLTAWSELLDDPVAGDRLTLAIQGVLGEYELADLASGLDSGQ